VAKGGPDRKVAEILNAISEAEQVSIEKLPHVHPDQSLSLALERMGTTGLHVLPVVSRANVRQLIGIIALDDILRSYGVVKEISFMDGKEI